MNAIVKLVKVFICVLFFAGPLSFTLIPEIKASEQQKTKCYYFGATWCGPCKKMKPLFKDKDVSKELSAFDFRLYDIDEVPEIKRKYKISVVPTMIFLKEKKQCRYQGGMSKQTLIRVLRKEK